MSIFDEAGFVGTLASNSEFEIERYLHLGEAISASTVIESISDMKQTRLGRGYFVTWVDDLCRRGQCRCGSAAIPHPEVQAEDSCVRAFPVARR